ncbi:MAG: type II toxin-antitoxin system HipA family toxin YjjJ [Myxococcota bacterium]
MPSELQPGVDALTRELRRGPAAAPDLARALGVSQPTFSRLVARDGGQGVLVTGRARATRYAARRRIERVGDRAPLFAIDEAGAPRRLAVLHAIEPRGFFVEALDADVAGGFFDDLPWFLHDLRPSGFLGRLVPRLHPELPVPREIGLWSGDHALMYLAAHGADAIGELVVGDDALGQALEHVRAAAPEASDLGLVPRSKRGARYARLAEAALASGLPGSSAAGEQPKFLAVREPGVAVLVKFSPALDGGDVATRTADLLVAEHLAHEVVRAAGHDAATSELALGGGRLFLEVERFDRVALADGGFGRRGVLSFAAADSEHVGHLESWVDTARALIAGRLVDAAIEPAVRWRAAFGRLIANSDMHHGNAAFLARGTRLLGLAPVYDMLPMAYAPRGGNVLTPAFAVRAPSGADLDVWPSARAAAEALWRKVAEHRLVSEGFRAIARDNAQALAGAARYVRGG